MKTKYLDFLKLNENSKSIIGLAEIEKTFKNVFDETKVSSVKSLYDVDEEKNETKLIISINNLFFGDSVILYTKFIFIVDDKKRMLKENKFSYLYDINSKFKEKTFNDISELEEELNSILVNDEFGEGIKKLSNNSVSLTSKTNEWFSKNGVNNISIYSIKYNPLVDNIPCESLFFRFEINIDDSRFIEMEIKKNQDNEFKLSFSEGDWFHHVYLEDLDGMVQVIGETIKNYLI